MKLLTLYLIRRLGTATLYALLALVALFSFFEVINAVDDVGDGNYTVLTLILYVSMRLFGHMYTPLPLAVLIGCLAALSQLASASEWTVIRTSGASLKRIITTVASVGLLAGLLGVALGEWVAPYMEQRAERLRLHAVQQTVSLGGSGRYHIEGGRGDDALGGGAGGDLIEGGEGRDLIAGGGGPDILKGGAGGDFILADSLLARKRQRNSPDERWTPPADASGKLEFAGRTWGALVKDGLEFIVRDAVDGKSADGVGTEGDRIYGGDGGDWILAGDTDDYIEADSARMENGKVVYDSGDDVVWGGGGGDTISGGAGNDRIFGDSSSTRPELHGRDVIDGGKGNDEITGEGGNDVIYGGDGDDMLYGDAQFDSKTDGETQLAADYNG